jgi:hypothetical protein
MRPYYLHKRAGIWYAELVDMGTGNKLTARSSGTTIRDEASIPLCLFFFSFIKFCVGVVSFLFRQKKIRY